MVPIVEPEVLMDADNTIDVCEAVTAAAWKEVFAELNTMGVHLPGILLKPNMIIAGKKCSKQAAPQEVAERTVRLLRAHVPPAVPGVVFLSGGQSPQQATEHLRIMNTLGAQPWKLTYSYGRALQETALAAWKGKTANVASAQAAFDQVAKANSAAALGKTLVAH